MADRIKSPNSADPPRILKIDSHSGLADARQEIANRLQANPAIAQLLLINPVCAFKDVGIEVSPAIAAHILHTMQSSSDSAAQRKQLTAAIKAGKAGAPKPLDPRWVARFLFEELKLKPLETDGAAPVYLPTIDPARNAAFLATLPQFNTSAPLPHPDHGTTFSYPTISAGVRHLDLNSPAPVLPAATGSPDEVDLTALYFYKDFDPRANNLLQLGILETQTFQISSADTYRKVKSGEIPNPWGDWISNITFTPVGQ